MTTVAEPVVQLSSGSTDGGDDDLVHLWCCDRDVAWCGLDLSKATEDDNAPESDECVVCVYMWRTGYPCSPGCMEG